MKVLAAALLAFVAVASADRNLRSNGNNKERELSAIDPAKLNQVIDSDGERALAIDPAELNQVIDPHGEKDGVELPPPAASDPLPVDMPPPATSDPLPVDMPPPATSQPLTVDMPPPAISHPKKPATILGDPHFTMFSGRKYDFHGGCDLVFLDNPGYNNGQGMKIHVRTRISTWWSYVQSAVIQIGEDTLEVMGGIAEKRYWVNGKRGSKVEDSAVMPFTIGGHKVRFRIRSDTQFQFKVFLENDQEIILRSVNDFMKVDIEHHTKATFGTSKGLLGTYEDGQMMARDGVTILDDANQFGIEWQVREEEAMLFHSAEGTQHPETCAMPTETQFQRRLGEQPISRFLAAKACHSAHVEPEDLEDCIEDVMATGDEAMAGAF